MSSHINTLHGTQLSICIALKFLDFRKVSTSTAFEYLDVVNDTELSSNFIQDYPQWTVTKSLQIAVDYTSVCAIQPSRKKSNKKSHNSLRGMASLSGSVDFPK